MRHIKIAVPPTLFCFAFLGIGGILPFVLGTEKPEQAVVQFVKAFIAQDADALLALIDPEVVAGKEIKVNDVRSFLHRFPKSGLTQEKVTIDSRFVSEDKQFEHFQATIVFRAPSPDKRYSGSCTLSMTFLWTLEGSKWWLERPLSIFYRVTTNDSFPTNAQTELAARFQAAVDVLDKLKLPGEEDLPLLPGGRKGSALNDYRELENLYSQERSKKGGVDPGAKGVQVLLRAAEKTKGEILKIYHGDFPEGADDRRRPIPWDMIRDYVQASFKLAKSYEKKGQTQKAESVYRTILSLARQILDEGGGLQCVIWGLTFQKQAAEELSRILPSGRQSEKERALIVGHLASRRLDVVQTALQCLDDMAEYRSLQAAMLAASRADVPLFRAWGINTLAIFALKDAPAAPEVIETTGSMVIVENVNMRNVALTKLSEISDEPTGAVRAFVERQKAWIRAHQVYRTLHTFR